MVNTVTLFHPTSVYLISSICFDFGSIYYAVEPTKPFFYDSQSCKFRNPCYDLIHVSPEIDYIKYPYKFIFRKCTIQTMKQIMFNHKSSSALQAISYTHHKNLQLIRLSNYTGNRSWTPNQMAHTHIYIIRQNKSEQKQAPVCFVATGKCTR